MKSVHSRVLQIFGKYVTLHTLLERARVQHINEDHVRHLWSVYWIRRDCGDPQPLALNEIAQIILDEDEAALLAGKTIDAKERKDNE